MARILCIDYGTKRCGLAVTDPLQITVNGLTTVEKKDLVAFVIDYCQNEDVEKIVVGHPELFSGRTTPVVQSMQDVLKKISEALKLIEIDYHDESYTSQKASQLLVASGAKKKKRREKGILDKMSAIVILQEYLGHI